MPVNYLTGMATFFLFLVVVLLAALVVLLLVWYLTYKSTLTMKSPFSNFHFQVEIGGNRLGFTEVSGLDIQVEAIEYREGNSPVYTPTKIPGQHRFSNIVLKRGLMKGDNEFYQWIQTAMSREVERRDMTISLLNERHEPVFIWKVRNAFPVKYSGPHLKSDANEIAIETLELAHEGLSVESL